MSATKPNDLFDGGADADGGLDPLQSWCAQLQRLPSGEWLNPQAGSGADEFAAQLDPIRASDRVGRCLEP